MTEEEARDLEQVAETALLSIGARLEWVFHVETWGGAIICTEEGHREYTVRFDPMISPYVRAGVLYYKSDGAPYLDRQIISNGGEGKRPRRLYNTIAEAKAACEVHAVTGQFPPSVDPM